MHCTDLIPPINLDLALKLNFELYRLPTVPAGMYGTVHDVKFKIICCSFFLSFPFFPAGQGSSGATNVQPSSATHQSEITTSNQR